MWQAFVSITSKLIKPAFDLRLLSRSTHIATPVSILSASCQLLCDFRAKVRRPGPGQAAVAAVSRRICRRPHTAAVQRRRAPGLARGCNPLPGFCWILSASCDIMMISCVSYHRTISHHNSNIIPAYSERATPGGGRKEDNRKRTEMDGRQDGRLREFTGRPGKTMRIYEKWTEDR